MSEQWVTMKEASKITGVSQSKLSRLAAIKAIEVRSHVVDRRIKLVNVEEIKRVFQVNQ